VIIEKPIKVGHLFCGIGGLAKGFNRANARVGNLQGKFICLGGIDSDPAAIKDFRRLAGVEGTVLDLFSRDQYIAFHGHEPPVGWRAAVPDDIRAAHQNQDPDIVTLSSPCLPADGLVITSEGERQIATISRGDLVLTHKGRFRRVTEVGKHWHSGKLYGFRLNGTVDFQWFTDEHPLWVRKVSRPGGRKRRLGEPSFIPAKKVRIGHRIGFPIIRAQAGTARSFIAGLGAARGRGVGQGRIVDLLDAAEKKALWFLIGCYLGDGYRRTDGPHVVSFCVGPENGDLAAAVKDAAMALGLKHCVDRNGGSGNVKLNVTGKHFSAICAAFGDGADKKRIPPSLMTLEDEFVIELISGYRATDGSEEGRRVVAGKSLQGRWKIPSISLQLLRDIQRLFLRTGTFASIHKCWPGGPQEIMGRKVNTRPRWELNVRLDPKKRTIFEFDGDVVWVRVRQIFDRDVDQEVWNLSVDEDDTFCAPMMATHNCKGFSGLLPEVMSKTDKYQALNGLTLRGVWLALEAYKDNPVSIFVFENVPRIATRGRFFLDQIVALFRAYGYAVAETKHDCGELGGLAQSRKRFLLVARHMSKVPNFLYQPPKRALRGVGEVLDKLPLPLSGEGGPMHRMPSLQWKTWVRLAFVRAGSDWRSLNDLRVENSVLQDYGIVPEVPFHNGAYGVKDWSEPAGTVTANGRPGAGSFSVADPRIDGHPKSVQLGVRPWDKPAGVVTGKMFAGGGPNSVADPRLQGQRFNNVFRIVRWDEASPAVAGPGGPAGGLAVADPRSTGGHEGSGKYRVTDFEEPAGTVIAASTTGQGAFAVADPRTGHIGKTHENKFAVRDWSAPAKTVTGSDRVGSGAQSVADPRFEGQPRRTIFGVRDWSEPSGVIGGESLPSNGAFSVADPRPESFKDGKKDYHTGGHYGVVPYDAPTGAVSAHPKNNNGAWSVADPRLIEAEGAIILPKPEERLIAVIRACDGTWHRPFTTLELAAIQSLVDPEEFLELEGLSDSAWRERIGNCVPPDAAEAMGGVIGRTLLLAWSGQTFELSSESIWVRNVAVALSIEPQPAYETDWR
jgi:site-specific DNA-cytosine methylase